VEFVAYYGSTDGTAATTLPIPFGQGKTRKPWTAASRTAIKARDAAQTEKEIQSAPVTPFQLVTVSL
jgi:hypothetical protein